MRQIVLATLASITLLMAGCDPGMTIRQTRLKAGIAENSDVIVRVSPSRQFIGETLYAPQVEITNLSAASITVTGVELAAQHAVFQSQTGSYLWELPQGTTKALDVEFHVPEGVKKTFQKSAELRVHYRVGTQGRIAYASIIGQHSNDAR